MAISRRRALLTAAASLLAGVFPWRRVQAQQAGAPFHPTPRKGITAAKVLTAAELTKSPGLIALFDGIREIPHIVDGIGCHCGCALLVETHYSLLSCYETENAMAKICPICQGEGRVAVRLAKAGKTLDEIREAIDAQFG
ncbi:MAG: hypothetical protein K2R93_11255 [Gemmatimonadaceae bacterium]|nr:hypothetical protein [Gemmatimonadaceae bacterium]